MKHKHTALTTGVIFTCLIIIVCSCKKINDGTELGGGLIPPVDNITTFETYLPTETDNHLAVDSSQLLYSDNMAVGFINDPEFGTTQADAYFNFSYASYGIYPFVNKDSVAIDSVVLSLSYQAVYGDSTASQTLRVFEIDRNSNPDFSDTTIYHLNQSPAFSTIGPELGSKTFIPKNLKDSILHIRGDTTKQANVIRIRLDTTRMGRRFINYDTTSSLNGGFHSDSLFKNVFRGLAIKGDPSNNALTYFSPADNTNTQLTIYFRYTKNGIKDSTASLSLVHLTNGQADLIKRTPGGNWAGYLANGNPLDNQLYIQSSPGSYASIRIPALDTFRNVTIHRAELIFTKLVTPSDNLFPPPASLFVDKINNAGDSVFTLDQDMDIQYDPTTVAYSYNSLSYGGTTKVADSTYRFKLTRYVQGIVTRKEPNYILRVYAPLRTTLYSASAKIKVPLYVTGPPGYGRIVLAGGNHPNPAYRVRLRLIYSKI